MPIRLSGGGHTHSHQALQTQELIINRAGAGILRWEALASGRQAANKAVRGAGLWAVTMAPRQTPNIQTQGRWRVETLKAQPRAPKAFPEASSAASMRQGSPCATPLARLGQEGGPAQVAQPWEGRAALNHLCKTKSV